MRHARRSAALALCTTLVFAALPALAGNVTWWTPNFNVERAEKLKATFEAANPGITIAIESTTTNGLPERVLTTLRSGSAPDIIDVQHVWVSGYAQNDLVQPVGELIDDPADFNKAALDYVTVDGKVWGVPYRIEALAVLCNRQHFVEAGLDPENPPRTWPELLAAAKAMTRSGRSGFAITGGGEVGNTIFRAAPFIWMNGGDIMDAASKTAKVNEPAAVEAVKFWTDMYVTEKVSPASTLENDGTANRRLFIAGVVSCYQSGQFDLGSIKAENPAIEILPIMTPHPEGKDTSAILGGWSWVIPKSAANPDDAKAFIRFLAQPENMGALTDTFPARTSAMSMPRFQDPLLKPFGAMLPFARPLPTHPRWVQIAQAFFDGVQRILTEEEDAQTAMDGAADDINALLQQ